MCGFLLSMIELAAQSQCSLPPDCTCALSIYTLQVYSNIDLWSFYPKSVERSMHLSRFQEHNLKMQLKKCNSKVYLEKVQLTWDQKAMAAEFSDLWDFQVTFLSCIFKLPGWEKDYTTGLNKDVIMYRSFCLFWNSLGIMSSLLVLLLPILKLQSFFLSMTSEKLLCVWCVGGGEFCCAGLWICTTSRAVLCRESRYGYHGSCRCHQRIQGKRHSSQRQNGTENFPQWFFLQLLKWVFFALI